ncbi:hypothetical protein CSC2_19620 [Clostridium zeae]|uniref:Transposase DDE domain-containing protein n=1 Tax=Clostridium zeae TaxID=2759022 RepID=A0ABQ1E9M4_9CLOT|nr:hypothetical protein CSC2_19620 [Clostridium zeae]
MALEVFYGYTEINKIYSPARISSLRSEKADAQKKLTEKNRFSDFFIGILKQCIEIKWLFIRCFNELTQRINMILSYSMAKTVNSLRSNSTVF